MSHGGAGLVGGDHGDDARRHLGGLLVSVDFDVLAGDLGELADLDVLTEQGGGLFDSQLDGGVASLGLEQLVSGVGVGVHGVAENFLGELDELRGLGHEVGLGVQLDGVAGLAIGGLDDLGGDGAFLSLAAFTLAGCGDTLGADDFLGAGDVAFGFGQSLLDVEHAGAGVFTNLLDQCGGNCCH